MFSRKLDWVNLRMTLECLAKLPIAWSHCIRVWWSFRPDVIYVANHHEVILLWPLLLLMRQRVVCHMHDPPTPASEPWRVLDSMKYFAEVIAKDPRFEHLATVHSLAVLRRR